MVLLLYTHPPHTLVQV